MALDKNVITKEAQKYASKGQYDKAIAEWKKLIKGTHDTRDLATLYNTVGDLCLKKDSKAEAADAFKRAADILAEDGLDSKAIAVYKKILNIDSKRIDVHLALGDLNARKGLTGNALESYKVVADHYQKNKEMGNALGIYQKMADLNPSNVAFRAKLGDMYAKEGMKKDAARAYLLAANVHIVKEAFNEARQLFEKVLSVDPENKEVYHKAGLVYYKEGKFPEACKAFKPAFESDPANEELTDLYLDALGKAGREQDAAEVYQRMLEQNPTRLDLREKLFHLSLRKKDYEKALAEARTLAEEQVKGLLAAAAEQGKKLLPGTVLPGADQETGAEKALKAFIEKNPDFLEARRTLSGYYEKVGRVDDAARQLVSTAQLLVAGDDRSGAREALNRALSLSPDLEEARRLLNQLDAAEAAPAREEAPVSAPAAPAEDPAIGEGLTEADVLIKYGLAAKALEQLEALAARFGDSLKVRLRLRDLYREQGNTGKAGAHALQAADICAKGGQQEQSEALLREALAIDPKNVEVLSRLGMAPPAPEEAPAAPEGPGELPPFEELPAGPGPEEPAVSPEFGEALTFEEPGAGPVVLPEEAPGEAPGETPEEAGPEAPPAAEEPAKELAAEPFEGEVDISEVWAEAEFYYQQGLFDEARKKYEKILEQKPDDPRTLKRIREISRQKEEVQEFANLAEAVEGLESFVPGGELAKGELATSASDEEAVRSLMQDIQFMKQQERDREREREREERERLEREEQEARLRAEQEARERAEQELRELRERFERERREREEQDRLEREERERLEREEQEARLHAEQEARERAEQELQELRERLERERLEREEQDRLEREEQERQAAAGRGREETDFGDLGEELWSEAPPRASAAAPDEDFGDLGTAFPAGAPAPSRGEKSEEFFDLAAELRDELGAMTASAPAAGAAEEQTLDEIFEDFKRGVEEQASKQDVNTHYNLGIAYKEMGLLDDAVAEFLMTSEGEPRFVESRYMLGLCFMEQGEYHKAVAEIHNALNYAISFGGTDEERISMLYDLGLAYQGAGNISEAIETFQQVADMDPAYRDVAEKLKELRAGEFVSLEELKEDIEKEISSKFLEEGERIEREEKTRKNDQVRN